ncbi:MAG: hypothetical protein MUE83_17045 [Tabrizicola sp.]|jgi:hypothetical protein|nr:hypothetical protein [Tabrizicola sp.]
MGSEGQIDPAMIRAAIHQAREAARQIGDLQAANARTIRTLEGALNQAIKGPLNDPSNLPVALAEHRRAHRSGVPSRIDSDPELRAFIRDRIDRMTYKELVAEIAAAFPKDRRVCKSVLSRWSIAQRALAQSPIT